MLDVKTMRAIGGLLARQARARAQEADAGANEMIDLGPLLEEWKAGTTETPVTYAAGDVRTYGGQPWKCAQGHTHHGETGWEPGVAASLWSPYHATDVSHALPWVQPTGAHDMYQAGEYMIWTDGKTYRCVQATAYSPGEYAQAWAAAEGQDGGEASAPGGTETAPDAEEWPAWYAWDGVEAIPWQNGSRCTHNGTRYISRVNNNHWEPGAPGVYDNIWEAQG